MNRILRAAALGAILVLAIPGAAFGATVTSTTVASATVDSTLSMTGIPATLDFSHASAGAVLTAPVFTYTVTSSDGPGSATLHMTATDFVNGVHTITAVGNMTYKIGGGSVQPYPVGGTNLNTDASYPVTLGLSLPANAHSGVYTSTLTFTASQ